MDKLTKIDPDEIGIANGNFFGLPCDTGESEIIIFPVPWDVTTSYRTGTAKGPDAILDASLQVDLFDVNIENAWDIKIGTFPSDKKIRENNVKFRKTAEDIIIKLGEGCDKKELLSDAEKVNMACKELNEYVMKECTSLIDEGKTVCVLGGEHSVPYGYICALANKYDDFGILHIDAHADMRDGYEGFTYSHASIMFNVLKNIPQVSKISQVGQRDFCKGEYEIIKNNKKVSFFSDKYITDAMFCGDKWADISDKIINSLPRNVYISFDIDGLSPDLCPSTGTPVPGGLSFAQADYLLYKLAVSDKHIIGFDLCEVAPGNDEWDANVGARLLYKLCIYIHHNHKK